MPRPLTAWIQATPRQPSKAASGVGRRQSGAIANSSRRPCRGAPQLEAKDPRAGAHDFGRPSHPMGQVQLSDPGVVGPEYLLGPLEDPRDPGEVSLRQQMGADRDQRRPMERRHPQCRHPRKSEIGPPKAHQARHPHKAACDGETKQRDRGVRRRCCAVERERPWRLLTRIAVQAHCLGHGARVDRTSYFCNIRDLQKRKRVG